MKPIPNFPEYSVTEDGQVWSHRSNKFLKPGVNSNGYSQCVLCVDGKKTQKCVHKFVAETYIPNPQNKPQANHIDGNKSNNHVSNLEWCTNSENHQHAARTGLKPHMTKLTPDDVLEIRRLLRETDLLQREIAERFDVNSRTVNHIKTGRRWSHI